MRGGGRAGECILKKKHSEQYGEREATVSVMVNPTS